MKVLNLLTKKERFFVSKRLLERKWQKKWRYIIQKVEKILKETEKERKLKILYTSNPGSNSSPCFLKNYLPWQKSL